ncbi:hypothetical protein B0H19DRAFT_1166944 [Mycena capillaripes]|nr:hypothetical protein B0H19DRAFT_102975 [Mycena capillaripes]KAJ6547693.1 hypothetical protein B0H19DRAFT_1166944 [Mycena capillaripes]
MEAGAVTIASLPGEVLAQIFKSGTTLSCPPGCLPCLITYSAVCERFRSAALDYPDLWSSINVPFSARNVVALIALCFERSKSCLFNITLALYSADVSVVTSVMLLVVQHVQRLRRLVITGTTSLSNPEEIFALLQNAQRAPRLAVLELVFLDPHPNVSMEIPPGRLLMQAPSLSSLRLHGVTSPVPFVGLRSLEIQGLRSVYADFQAMAVASPLLTELILPRLRLMVDLQSMSLAPIEIPSLKTLALSFSKPHPSNQFNPCHDLLSLLSIPNLEYLELAGGHIPDLNKSFQNPSVFTKLRTLRLVNIPFHGQITVRNSRADNSDFLYGLSTIEELEFIHSHPERLLLLRDTTEQVSMGRPRARSISREIRSRPIRLLVKAPVDQHPFGQQQTLEPPYPNLRSVSLDTLLAGEALWLYQLVLDRPQIQVVKLSQMTERHLATSMGTVDGVLQTTPHLHLKQLSQPDATRVNVGKLLRDRVVVKEIDNDGYIQWQGAVI